MPADNYIVRVIKDKNMNLDYSKDFIGEEIQELFSSVEDFLAHKDTMTEAIRYLYLNTSCNN